jgi:mannose/cellobiose epimerase-like protein (N-acyl-D-glucosamine 2-epimerase family)
MKNNLPSFGVDAEFIRQDLRERVLPYWHDTTVDPFGGGYALSDDAVRGRTTPVEKQVVTQARLVWGFSLAHRKGYGDDRRDYRKAAAHGVEFLRARMHDPDNGGYFFSVTPDGKPLNPGKLLYGQAFVIYALVEYYRATRERSALSDALELFRLVQERAHDARNRGWNEHFERDWKPLAKRDPKATVEVAGYKSANTHVHLMEAFTELYAESRDGAVRAALVESLELNRTYFYPPEPARSAFHFQPDWQAVTDRRSAGLSYGHNVEFAWLMVRAVEVLGIRPAWAHFHAYLEHTLRWGADSERGGVFKRGDGNGPASDTDKVWWVQAEMLAALTDGLRNRPGDRAYIKALRQLLDFVARHQVDAGTGIWLDTVTADGKPKATGLAHSWKGNYHDVRALVRFVEAMS